MNGNRTARLNLVSLEQRDVPSTTNLFDANFYLARNPDVAAAVQVGRITPEDHFRRSGDAEGRSGSPVFDNRVYLDDNPDVRAAVSAGRITAFRHFELAGQFERRSSSRAFSSDDYLRIYPDVAAAVRAGQVSAAEHFQFFGQREDRLPFASFSRANYLDDNPDVRVAVQAGRITAVAHYENFGRFEGRRYSSATQISVQAGQTTTITGTSRNHDDKVFFSYVPATSGTLRVVVESTNGVFAQAEIENARTSVNVLETDPNNGVNTASGQVSANTPYLLRMRAPDDLAAQFTVRLTLN